MPYAAPCEQCGTLSGIPKISEKLDPRNLRPHRKRLCSKCRTKLGYTVVSYGQSKSRPQGAEA